MSNELPPFHDFIIIKVNKEKHELIKLQTFNRILRYIFLEIKLSLILLKWIALSFHFGDDFTCGNHIFSSP